VAGLAFFHRRSSSCGRPADFRLTCYYTRRILQSILGGPTRHAPSVSCVKLISANVHSHSSCKTYHFLSSAGLHRHPSPLTFESALVCRSSKRHEFTGIGVGTIVLAINVILLGVIRLVAISLRHLAGGFLDQFSKSPTCYRAYACVTCFNRRHMLWLGSVCSGSVSPIGTARLCSMGVWHDARLF
jgi:hypothetical protein